MKIDTDAPNYFHSYYSHGVRFKDWKKKLDGLTHFVSVDLTDEDTKKMLEKD